MSTTKQKTIKLSSIKPNPNNPRLIKDDKFFKLVESIKTFGEKMMPLRPIVIDENKIILGGNMRFKALKELGYKEVPAEWIKAAKDLTEEQKKEFIIKDNVGFGNWDFDVLANEWDSDLLEGWGLDMEDFDFDNFTELEASEDDYEEPENLKIDVVLGDLIEIGEHVLLCGDCTCLDSTKKIIENINIDLVFTDPPYGIEVVQNNSVGGGGALKFGGKKGKVINSTKGFSKIIGDDTTDTAQDFYNTCLSFGIENFILFGGNYFTDFLPPSMGWIVWYKKNTGNFADFEMAWTSYNKAARLYEYLWNGLSREGERRLELIKRVHPTQKPVGLNIQILKNYECDKIYDGFLGSGSTMVACHELNKICYGMELDPHYCQIIIDRMTKLDPELKVKINGKAYEKEDEVPF